MNLLNLIKARKTAAAAVPEAAREFLPQEALAKYLAQVTKFTDLLPSILDGSNSLNDLEKKHLEIIQSFKNEMNDIFLKQEVMASSSTMVLETSWDYKQVIISTQQMLEGLLTSFDQALGLNDQVEGSMDRLAASISHLSTLVGMMAELSNTIRQLSRNAEIMSYHAGLSGKGFAIIAEKMSGLTGELEQAALRAPEIDADLKSKLAIVEDKVTRIRELAVSLRTNAVSVRERLGEIFNLNQNIIKGFEDIQQASDQQKNIKAKLLSGMADIVQLAENLGVAQEVVASVLSTETADAGQINFIREQLENIITARPGLDAPWARRQLVIELELIKSKLESARSRWLDLNQSISNLRQTVQSEERIPAELLKELEDLFEGIEQIGLKLTAIDGELTRTQNSSQDIEGKLSRADEDLKHWYSWLVELKSSSEMMEAEIKRLHAIGETVRSFAEQIKLLAFYAAVEVADMGDSGTELKPLVDQARDLANKANADSAQISPLLDKIGAQFRESMDTAQRNMEILGRILKEVSESNWSLSKLKESAEQFELIGRETAKLIGQQRQKRTELATIYAGFANTFQEVSFKLEELFRLLSRANELLNIFGQYDGQLFDRIDRSTIGQWDGGALEVPLTSDPITLDPSLHTDATSTEVISQMFEGLVQFDKGANVIPGVSWHWTISPDGLTWTFHLRKGIKFHHGRELNAADIKYTIERILSPELKAPNSYLLSMIKGADDYSHGRAAALAGIKVVDPHCLVITLTSPYMPFLANLAASVSGIVPKEEVERLGADFARSPVGSGPFRFRSWEPGRGLVIERFEDYYEQKVPVKEVRFHINPNDQERRGMFYQGTLDHTDIHQREVAQLEVLGKKIHTVASLNVQYICINMSKATPFAHKLVRQAMNYAIDKQALIDKTELKGEAVAARGVFPPVLSAHNKELEGYGFDPDRARKLLADAGFSGGPPGEYLLDIRDVKAQLDRAELVREYCLDVGIKLKINPIGWRELLDRAYNGDSLLSFRGWSSDNGDPDNFLYPLFHSSNWGRPGNTAFYKSPMIDSLLDKALAIRNPIERLASYREIERLIVEDAPWVFLYHSIRFVATQPWLHGFRPRPMGAPRLKDCWMEPKEIQ